MSQQADINPHLTPDALLQTLADYVLTPLTAPENTWQTARYCLLDSIGCGLAALQYPACTKLLGPIVPGTTVPNGTKIIGTSYQLDPERGAFNLGMLIRWLDYNDTWLAAEWGHPSDNLGAILACADWISRTNLAQQKHPLKLKTVLEAMIKAHEIQGVLALNHAFNRVGLDHVVLVKVASTAVCTWLLGGTREEIINAISHAWVDGQALRTYRHAPNTGSRKSWAAGDACSRAVRLALIALTGEMGIPNVLSTPIWGFEAALFKGQKIELERPLTHYVMDNVLFKISYPAEFHAQTAVECAMTLHPQVVNRIDQIKKITIRTHQAAIRIIDKQGILRNPADRDHCIQYMVAIPLIFGRLTAADYEDNIAQNPHIDLLRAKMHCVEDLQFSQDYLDPNKRSIANAISIEMVDGTTLPEVTVHYPIGHPQRRQEGIPLLLEKFEYHLNLCFSNKRQKQILNITYDHQQFIEYAVDELMNLLSS